MFDHARHLLQQDFDRLSVTNIQVYILLSTYKLAFGGPAQAHTFLSTSKASQKSIPTPTLS